MFERLDAGDFDMLCPDDDVPRLLDELRIPGAAGDIVENRSALARWHPDYARAFEAFIKQLRRLKAASTQRAAQRTTGCSWPAGSSCTRYTSMQPQRSQPERVGGLRPRPVGRGATAYRPVTMRTHTTSRRALALAERNATS
jgi:hypothetical protein